jgi:hypothetical protein
MDFPLGTNNGSVIVFPSGAPNVICVFNEVNNSRLILRFQFSVLSSVVGLFVFFRFAII